MFWCVVHKTRKISTIIMLEEICFLSAVFTDAAGDWANPNTVDIRPLTYFIFNEKGYKPSKKDHYIKLNWMPKAIDTVNANCE